MPKKVLTQRRGPLGPAKQAELDRALMIALGLAGVLDAGSFLDLDLVKTTWPRESPAPG